MLDFNSTTMFQDRINYLIDLQIDKSAADVQPRDYLGASVAGMYCDRALQYTLLATRGEIVKKIPTARIQRIFDRGHIYEEKARQWLINAGFVFGKPRGFTDMDGRFKGHVDGVIVGWDDLQNDCPVVLPVLWECKCLGSKYWKKLEKDGLKAYEGTYYPQVQLYMHYIGLQRCLFTAVNADDMRLYHELINLNVMEAQLYKSRILTVLTTTDENRMMQRCSADRNYYQCKMCEFADLCWGVEIEKGGR